jgi:4-diphosphocytidyl-2-C-methyl-D-erythritol kinase
MKEPAPAKLNLALHVRGKLPDGRHRLETLFAFCVDGDVITAEPWDGLHIQIKGPFAPDLESSRPTSVEIAAMHLAERAEVEPNVRLTLDKRLPVASGIGGGSADAAATLRLLTRLWKVDPTHASALAPMIGSDVPACLLSMTAFGEGAGDDLRLVHDANVSGRPVLLVNPLLPLSTGDVFARWDGRDLGPLSDWREGRNDLQRAARSLVPQIGEVLDWLSSKEGASFTRMSGSGATCFALFDDEQSRNAAALAVPDAWWHMASVLR